MLFADLSLRPEAQELVSRHSKSSRSPCKAVFQETDVREWDQLDRMFEVAKREFGDVDVVCPGAGVYEPVRSQVSANQTDQLWNILNSNCSSHLQIFGIHLVILFLPTILHQITSLTLTSISLIRFVPLNSHLRTSFLLAHGGNYQRPSMSFISPP